ncbi:arsenate reductase (glutaredoxin) [Cellulophaga sp. HaHaR_3_176]|uniref:arsenate reductase (glutaredoxin) n=1 Tax=Cellulophaga sp. HaHaR_3_176 TaxID=1942464 RepID=UPI001C1FD86E|nr:arsenate reductase (glutaredoxin) [Cellulophaga sp. HaHaR_3_176]QWX85447.1 arsenate reductase (glutaredoxin) [Cellulophaga sp. HaHaR_3_176]
MIKIYHNPRCQKSRETLAIIEAANKDFEIVKYLENIPTKKELQNILSLLAIPAIDLVRKNEAVWKELYKDKTLSEDEVINAMLENPKLIERPIVINNGKAIIGRPPSSVKPIL